MSQNKHSSNLRNLVKNPFVNDFFVYIPVVSFLFANIFIILFFNSFIAFNDFNLDDKLGVDMGTFFTYIKPILFYLIGIMLSVAFAKPNWMIRISELISLKSRNNSSKENKYKLTELNSSKENESTVEESKKTVWNLLVSTIELIVNSLLLFRTILFNIFNDSFILLVFWVSYLLILSFINIVTYSSTYEYSVFFSAIGMVGILAGFFQYYTKTYHDNVISKIEKHLLNYVTSYLSDNVTFVDFKAHFSNTNNQDEQEILRDIDYAISNRGVAKKELRETFIQLKQTRTPLNISISNNYFSSFDNMSSFRSFDNIVTGYNKEKKKVLNQMYLEYFRAKYLDFVQKVSNDNISNLRSMLLPAILFFDEMDIDLYRLNSLSKRENDINNNDSFIWHYDQLIIDCYFIIVDNVTLNEISRKFVK